MIHRPLLAIALALVVIATTACAAGAPTSSTTPAATAAPSAPNPSTSAQALSFAEYTVAFCAAFDGLFEAVGNPDAGSPSVLGKSLDDAVAARDTATAERQAAAITSKLEAARAAAATAGRWPTAGPMMAQMDRVLVAFEAMTAAKRAAAGHAVSAADPQVVFEKAGGAIAWFAMLDAFRGVARPSGAVSEACSSGLVTP